MSLTLKEHNNTSQHQNVQAITANSTQIDHSQLANPMFDMSVLHGISKISYSFWESAKNVSLFGRGRNVSEVSDISISSELCDLSDIAELSLNITIQNTTVLEDSVHENKKQKSKDEPEDGGIEAKHTDERNNIYTGLANPEITPIGIPHRSRCSRIRTRSECSPLIRAGPYDVPLDIILRKKQRANRKTQATHHNETPTSKRRRNWSESFSSKDSPGKINEIDCVRVRDSGLYDSSNGLGSYFHLEHNYLDYQDTGKIDKERLRLEIRKALSIPGNESQSFGADSSASLVWNEEEIEAVSRSHTYGQSPHPIDQRNCLMYLLGRMINHSTRLLPIKPIFNGLKITLLPDKTEKFPAETLMDSIGQPLILLHLGNTSRSVNIISKKSDPHRLKVYDVLLENFSLLTIFPDTYRHMNISLASEGNLTGDNAGPHILISPCFIPPSEPLESNKGGTLPDEVGIDDDPKETDAEDHDNLKKTEYAEYDANSKESADGNSKETSDEDDDNSWETADEDDDNPNSKEKVAVASNDKEGTSIRETISPCLIKMDDPVADCTLLSDNETVKCENGTKPVSLVMEASTDCDGAELIPSYPKEHDHIEITQRVDVHDKQDTSIDHPEEVASDDTTDDIQGSVFRNKVTAVDPEKKDSTSTNSADPSVTESVSLPDKEDTTIDHPEKEASEDTTDGPKLTKLFLRKETLVQLADRNSKSKIVDWVKLCHMRVAHTAELNRKMVLEHLIDASQGKVKLQPSLIEKLVKKLNDDAVSAELMNIGLKVPKNARLRKGALETYLNNEFSTLNTSDYNETCHLEESRIGSPKTKKQKGKGTKTSKKSKAVKKHGKTEVSVDPDKNTQAGVTTRNDMPIETDITKAAESVLEPSPPDLMNKEDKKDSKNSKDSSEQVIETNSSSNILENATKPRVETEKKSKKKSEKKNTKNEANCPKKTETVKAPRSEIPPVFPGKELMKPLKTLETSLLKIQNNVSCQEEQIRLLQEKDQGHVKIAKTSECLCQTELTELRSQMDTMLQIIEVQQGTLLQLTEMKDEINLMKERIAEIPELVQAALMAKRVQRTIIDNEHTYSKRAHHGTEDSAVEMALGVVINSDKIDVSDHVEVVTEHEFIPNSPPKSIPVIASEHSRADSLNFPINYDPGTYQHVNKPASTETQMPNPEVIDVTIKTIPMPCATTNVSEIPVSETETSDPLISENDVGLGWTLIENRRKEKTPTNNKRKCLIVHDHFFEDFASSKFTSAFYIDRHKVKSISSILSRGGLISKARNLKSDLIYIHAGLEDLYKNKTTPKDLIANYKKLVYDLLESTSAKVCVSLMIPIPGLPDINEDISYVNKEVSNFVSYLRRRGNFADRIYCSCNERLGGFVTRLTNSQNRDLSINENGKRLLWLRLKDCFYRCLDLQNPSSLSKERTLNE